MPALRALLLRALLLLALLATLPGCPPSSPRHATVRCPAQIAMAAP